MVTMVPRSAFLGLPKPPTQSLHETTSPLVTIATTLETAGIGAASRSAMWQVEGCWCIGLSASAGD